MSSRFFDIFQNFEKFCLFGHKTVLKQLDFLGRLKKAYFSPTASTRVRNLDEGEIKDISVRKKEKNVFVAILITLI